MATTAKIAVAAVLAVLAAAAAVLPALATPYERAECNRYQSCNGEMCVDICEIGSVVLDSWASGTAHTLCTTVAPRGTRSPRVPKRDLRTGYPFCSGAG